MVRRVCFEGVISSGMMLTITNKKNHIMQHDTSSIPVFLNGIKVNNNRHIIMSTTHNN